jgi:anaerobic selenocysteine-containing dehydrogenase
MEEGFIEINHGDAERLSIRNGDPVNVSSRRGTVEVKALVTKRIEAGSVFMPFHFIETCANILTNTAHDPICKIPELKVCAVNIEKAAVHQDVA